MVRLIVRFPALHRLVHRLFPRPYVHEGMPLVYCPVCAFVWSRLEAQPGFNERMRTAEAELAAGRGVRLDVDDIQ